MKFNIASKLDVHQAWSWSWIFDIVILDPATGAQKLLDIDDEKR